MPRVALVTGGAVRVGRALTLGLAEAGYDLLVAFHSSEREAHEVARQVEALGRRAVLARADLARADEVVGVAKAARDAFGRLDLLVNNASTFEAAPLTGVDADAWDRVQAVNVRAPFLLLRESVDLLRSVRGSVVNVLDLSAFQPWSEHPHHAVSKAALHQLTRVAARALAPHVRVNAVAPGTVLPPSGTPVSELEQDLGRTPLGALGSPEDVVRSVLFLADSPFITGEVVLVDGGRHLTF